MIPDSSPCIVAICGTWWECQCPKYPVSGEWGAFCLKSPASRQQMTFSNLLMSRTRPRGLHSHLNRMLSMSEFYQKKYRTSRGSKIQTSQHLHWLNRSKADPTARFVHRRSLGCLFHFPRSTLHAPVGDSWYCISTGPWGHFTCGIDFPLLFVTNTLPNICSDIVTPLRMYGGFYFKIEKKIYLI